VKLLIAIVNNDDAHIVNSNLSKAGYSATKIASTGGFLLNGNSTFLIGVNDEDVDRIIELIGTYSKKRVQPAPVDLSYNTAVMGSFPAEVTVGGATIFVMDVERCRRV
jgi:uncharacterized protein YaaQ